MRHVGVLLNNIGTPEDASDQAVAKYLREFLMDEDVVAIPRPFRDVLVKGLIVPFRAPKSAAKYRKIWMPEGSPLWVYSQRLQLVLQKLLDEQADHSVKYSVAFGMNFGAHKLEAGIAALIQQGVSEIMFVPLFPQFAEATTGSAERAFQRLLKKLDINLKWKALPPFYRQSSFLGAVTSIIRTRFAAKPFDHLLFSYHSLPESQIRKQRGCLEAVSCCDEVGACDKPCYRAQCLATTRLILSSLQWEGGKATTAFQSRLGPVKWIGPMTSDVVVKLAKDRGVSRLAVVCPSFVTDCLETLEEVGLEVRDQFLAAGGKEFQLIPCLNDEPEWGSALAKLVTQLQT